MWNSCNEAIITINSGQISNFIKLISMEVCRISTAQSLKHMFALRKFLCRVQQLMLSNTIVKAVCSSALCYSCSSTWRRIVFNFWLALHLQKAFLRSTQSSTSYQVLLCPTLSISQARKQYSISQAQKRSAKLNKHTPRVIEDCIADIILLSA